MSHNVYRSYMFLCNLVNDSDKSRYYYRACTDSKIKSMYILESVSKWYFDALLHANFIELSTHRQFSKILKKTHRCKEKNNSICSEWTVVHRMMNEYYIKLSTSMIEIRDQYFFNYSL